MNRKQRLFAAICISLFGAVSFAGCSNGTSAPAPAKPETVIAGDRPAPGDAKVDPSAPWPMFGGTPSRNMVNTTDKNIPTTWDVESKKNIKWIAELGDHSYAGPVVADGKIFVGTNNKKTKKEDKVWKAVLMAFDEGDGKFLWQIAHDIPNFVNDEASYCGLCSTPVVEDKRLYYVTPGCEVICAGTDGKIVWTLDMHKELKVVPFHLANCSPLVVGDLVMVITSNGTDSEGKVIAPKAPSFIGVNKKTGKVAWQSNLPGDRIIEGQWSNPTVAVVDGKKQVLFAGGDCVIYSLEPATGKMIWKCDCNPAPKKKGNREIDNYIISTPVVASDKLYVALGVFPTNGATPRSSYFLCLDVTKKGDVSLKSYNAKDPANKDSALVWAVGGLIDPPPPRGRQARFANSFATAAVHDGLVYITEEVGYLSCFDAKTGQLYWEHDFKDNTWASPYYVDGKIYVGTLGGNVGVFEHGKECKYYVDGKLLPASKENYKKLSNADLGLGDHDIGTAVVANGVLYFVTKSKLIAIVNSK
jgi:outer membrane protein assembly factor BamB